MERWAIYSAREPFLALQILFKMLILVLLFLFISLGFLLESCGSELKKGLPD